MKRKTAIQSILALVTLGVSGVTYEFFKHGEPLPLNQLPQKKQLLAELAETIIPRTNTPGAKDCKVEDYITKMVIENTDARAQKIFLTGLADVGNYANSKYRQSFVKCSVAQRNEILKHFENKGTYSINILNKARRKFLGASFFNQLRDLTVEGYATSFLGATKGMAYDYIPGVYQACIPLQKNQLAWATK
ncbi:gluconate 2-dehydrogenase subunit 3 family protein [Mucilaginibacter sp. UYCu711]|uniref:gluconate 2-dehydrogenase subunit 3 family protein n=1 Tax=Mucilaginibacter sp. UYCu711 TaxID=3156339 RepID=UPI003D2233E2